MADRFQDRPLPDDLDRIDPRGRGPAPARGGESDPLAELARLIGQNDPFGGGGGPAMGRSNAKVQTRAPEPPSYRAPPPPPPSPVDDQVAAGPPPWMQRTGGAPTPQTPLPEPDFRSQPPHPMQRYGADQGMPQQQQYGVPQQQQYRDEPAFDDRGQEGERYDDALFGQIDTGPQQGFARDQGFGDDPYAFQDEEGYDEGEEEEPKRSNGLAKIAVVLALAVIGTGAAFAYRTYMGATRTGEPPIIRADNSPTKILTAVPSDGIPKLPDRMTNGDQGEKMVSREETPVDVNTRSVNSPRVVFPALNQANGSPQAQASMAPSDMTTMPPVATSDSAPPNGNNGTMGASEPRRIKTLSVRGDQGDGAAAPAAAAAMPATPKGRSRNAASSANASANAPMSLSPQQAAPAADRRVAAVAPTQTDDAAASPAASDGGFLVQVSSQKSEADAQTSFRALKTKYPDAMGSYTPVIKKVDIPGKGVMYRAMIGPFDTADAANQFCSSLKTAGGQCFVPRK